MQMKAWLLPFLLFALSVGLSSSLSLSPGAFLRQLTSPAFGSSPNPYTENGRDPDYPWCFTGRLWFRPAIVRIPSSPLSPPQPQPGLHLETKVGWCRPHVGKQCQPPTAYVLGTPANDANCQP